ncbi:hypothetical protein CYMTET_16163 [Cymbomonas tetramitiformis]|uniref:DUF7869 domain-containing protein n=1 Tax=Cymbomonas tetramitiformis TaxID=36881 RepID=A0AAE0GCS8_9CHLO|nr:hypothetical protein CYMTET_16163 [Cymbomonas tetramitiformis]
MIQQSKNCHGPIRVGHGTKFQRKSTELSVLLTVDKVASGSSTLPSYLCFTTRQNLGSTQLKPVRLTFVRRSLASTILETSVAYGQINPGKFMKKVIDSPNVPDEEKLKLAESSITERICKEWRRQFFCKRKQQETSDEVGLAAVEEAVVEEHAPTAASRRERQSVLKDFGMSSVSKAQAAALTFLLGTFFFACRIPFHVVDNVFFRAFIKALCPGYMAWVPCKNTLRTTTLDNAYEETLVSTNATLDATPGKRTLVIDGKTNVVGRATANLAECKQGITAYITTKFFRNREHSGKLHAEFAYDVISEDPEKWQAVCADNTGSMQIMFRLLHLWFPLLFILGRCVRVLDLLIEDIVKIEEVSAVVADFYFIAVFMKSAAQFERFETLIGDSVLRKRGEAINYFLEPLSSMLHYIEGDSVPPTHMLPLFVMFHKFVGSDLPLSVSTQVSRDTLNDIREMVKERWLGAGRKVGLRHDFHCLAFSLDVYVRALIVIIFDEAELNRIDITFSDTNVMSAIKNYNGGKTADRKYHCLLQEFNNFKAGELDNVSTNKSKLMLAYAAWLIHTDVFRKVKLSFLLVGHTHENIDQMFSRFSVRLRRKQAWTLDEMIEVAQECFTDGVTCEHTEKIFDFSSWFDGHVFDCHNILAQQAFKFKKDEHGEVGMQYKQYSISPKWLPETPLPKLASTPPVAGPGYIKPIPFTEEGIEKLEHALQALKDILGTKLTDVHENFWREDAIEKQRHLTAGGECQAPAIPFQHPEKIVIERNATLVRLIEAPALAIEAAGAAAVPAIPMTVGSFAVALAVESENDKFAFRVQLRRSEWSDPLYLVKVEARYPSTQQLLYRYFQPKKHTDTKKKHLGKQLASHPGAFAAPPGHRPSTETFDKNEIVLAWNVDAKDPERSIPNGARTEQYAQIVVALLAQQFKRTRKDLGDLNESDDSDEDEAFDNCVAVAVAREVDA